MFSRRKIPLLFLLGVGLPSLALGTLAVRGIRNELALQEQRSIAEHRTLARLVADTVAYRIAEVERVLSATVAGQGDPEAAALVSAVGRLETEAPLAEAVFLLEDPGIVTLPAAHFLFLPDGQLPEPHADWAPAAASSFETGQEREFRQHRYRAAAESYRLAFDQVGDPVLKCEALLAVARNLKRVGDQRAALGTYQTLATDFGEFRTSAGLPVGPVTRLEQSSLLSATGDTAGARAVLLDLYRRLVAGEWSLEQAQYDRYTSQALAALDSLPDPGPGTTNGATLVELKARERLRRAGTERLLAFRAAAVSEFAARLSPASAGGAGPASRFTLESAGRTYLVALLDPVPSRVWGVLLDPDSLGALVQRTLEANVDTAGTDWLIVGGNGGSVPARDDRLRGSLTVNATFADNFPPWLIEFYQRPESPYKRLFASGQSIYLYMFLLIATILVFGLVLTVRTINYELELARLKSDFVSTVSHEFKSPLTSIRQMAEMLQGGRVPGEERRQRYYDVLVEQSTRLSSLVTNILDLARIDEGRKELRFESMDVGELVKDLATTTQHRVGHEGFTIRVHVADPLPPVHADRDALGQALSNLVDNAIQYSGEAREVDLHASLDGDHLVVAVEDSGIGIPEEEIDQVFERFFRGGDALTRTVKGSGLGLTLVREIVEAHGGSVHVESKPGRGSRFSIRLPAMTEQGDAEDPDRRG